MTKEQLDEIRKRSDAASPAPWHYVHGYGFCSKHIALNISDGPPDANTEFITHARQDIPALLTEIEALQVSEIYITGLLEGMQKEITELKLLQKPKFKGLTDQPIPENELKAALEFEDFDSKEQMMCGWQRVHRELHVIASAYRKAIKKIEELKAECLRLTEENEKLDNDSGITKRNS